MLCRQPARGRGNASIAFWLVEVFIIGELFEGFGVICGYVGKWYLGVVEGLCLLDWGFDVFFGFYGG